MVLRKVYNTFVIEYQIYIYIKLMGDFWKPTAEMFGSLFEKPKMSEKLLVKPPFKYIFDIIMETTKATGFEFK